MDIGIRHTVFMSVSVALASLMLVSAVYFTNLASAWEQEHMEAAAMRLSLREQREWNRYTGPQTGADVIDFIVRHKDALPIVIESPVWDASLLPFLTNGTLVLGTWDERGLPDYIWDKGFLYHVLLRGQGSMPSIGEYIMQNGEIVGMRYQLGGYV